MLKIASNALFKQILPNAKRLTTLGKSYFASKPSNPLNPFEVNRTKMTWNGTDELRTKDVIAQNVGLNKFMMRMYNTTALSIGGALGAAYIGTSIPMLAMNPGMTAIVGGLTMLASLIGVQYIKPISVMQNVPGVSSPIYKTQNPISRILLYTIGIASLGLSTSPLFMYMYAINPSIITSALGLTCGIFGGASLMAYNMPKDKMLGYGRVFMGSLLGLIGIQLIGIGSTFFMGPNALSSFLFQADTYIGALLFTGLIAYDTHVAIKEYENGYADHLGMSIQMLLNFWNLLIRIMYILGNNKD